MAGRMRVGAAVLVTLLMFSMLPAVAQAETGDLAFESTLNLDAEKGYYATGDTVVLQPTMTNNGDSTTYENDPSCGAVLQIMNPSGEVIVDGQTLCRGQSQIEDIAFGETHEFSVVEWELFDDDGTEVQPGWYTAIVLHTATGLTSSHQLHVQTDVILPSELTMAIEATSRLGPLVSSEEIVLTVTMYNPTASPIILPDLGGCLLQYRVNEATSLSSQCLPSFTQIEAFEQTLLEQRLLHAGSLEAGQNVISVALPGNALQASLNLDIAPPVDDFTVEWQDQLEVSIIGLEDALYADGEVMSTTMLMENVGNERQSMRFTDTCRAELWIINDQGEVVFDSRLFKTCNAVDLDYNLDTEEEAMFTLPDWTFTDLVGCQIAPGDYTAVIEVPQFHLSSSNSISYERLTSSECGQPLPIDLLTSLSALENGFDLSVTVVPQVSDVELRWIGLCSVIVSIVSVDASEEVLNRPLFCKNHDGKHMRLPYSVDDRLVINVGEIYMLDSNNSALPNGTYHLIVTLEANPSTSVGFVFEWPIVDTVAPEPVGIVAEPQPEEARLVSGTWSGLQTEDGTCWILDSPQEGQLLLSRAALGSWTPQQGWSGTYQAVNSSAAPQCANFQAPSLDLTGVEIETSPIVEEPAEQQSDAPRPLTIDEETTPIATTLVVVVTTTSLLSLLVTVALGNESFRIPSTAAGLWFLGMVGRTHETTDGRYQRGRLMGYLTANPGCHFRALMAALDMSNGQITHHLRILETEEAIWRRKDGRLVRYYPLTNTMNPGMSEEELPVPPLSPDPNSLQGKILKLLDADGPMGEFPTQAELAKRLEKSQQLVSHHLRTLQKFGLVEKRKMGIKNRYKLTREAIFLLETNDDFIRD